MQQKEVLRNDNKVFITKKKACQAFHSLVNWSNLLLKAFFVIFNLQNIELKASETVLKVKI